MTKLSEFKERLNKQYERYGTIYIVDTINLAREIWGDSEGEVEKLKEKNADTYCQGLKVISELNMEVASLKAERDELACDTTVVVKTLEAEIEKLKVERIGWQDQILSLKKQLEEATGIIRSQKMKIGVLEAQGEGLSRENLEHLVWIWQRMNNVHHESENLDYMKKFRDIIALLQHGSMWLEGKERRKG